MAQNQSIIRSGDTASSQAQSVRPIRCNILEKLIEVGRKTVFRLTTKSGHHGTGFLQQVKRGGTVFYLLVTSHNVLSSTSLREICDMEVHFERLPRLQHSHLERQWIRYAWTSEELDATVIQLSDEAASSLRRLGADFLSSHEGACEQPVACGFGTVSGRRVLLRIRRSGWNNGTIGELLDRRRRGKQRVATGDIRGRDDRHSQPETCITGCQLERWGEESQNARTLRRNTTREHLWTHSSTIAKILSGKCSV